MPAKPSVAASSSPAAAARSGPSSPSLRKPAAPAAANGSHVNGAKNGTHVNGTKSTVAANKAKAEPKILFQKYFKSVGPRTYAAQVKEAGNGNQFLVLTEGKRDPETGEVKKTKVFVYSEDFGHYFRMLHETAQFIKAHPVSEEVKLKRQRYWAKKEAEQAAAARLAQNTRMAAAAAATPVRPAKVSAPAKPAARRPARGR